MLSKIPHIGLIAPNRRGKPAGQECQCVIPKTRHRKQANRIGRAAVPDNPTPPAAGNGHAGNCMSLCFTQLQHTEPRCRGQGRFDSVPENTSTKNTDIPENTLGPLIHGSHVCVVCVADGENESKRQLFRVSQTQVSNVTVVHRRAYRSTCYRMRSNVFSESGGRGFRIDPACYQILSTSRDSPVSRANVRSAGPGNFLTEESNHINTTPSADLKFLMRLINEEAGHKRLHFQTAGS